MDDVTNSAVQATRQLVATALESDARVEVAYLFGSAARGPLGGASDVDVAIGFDEPSDALERLRVIGELEDRLVEVLRRRVDVIDLFRAPPLLLHQILRDGRPPVVARDERRRLEFENRARRTYFEMKRRYAAYDRESAR